MKRINPALAILLLFPALALLISCQDDMSNQGSTLVTGEVAITVDSIPTRVPAESVAVDQFDARATTKLIGRINVPEYGALDCSFVTQLYPSPALGIPDSIATSDVDSIKMILTAIRGAATGDTLAPQQLRVYKLDKQLPSGITNNINPKEYYAPSGLVATQSYTLSAISKSDSAFMKDQIITIPIRLPKEMATQTVERYRTDPSLFQWPSTFTKEYPGIYVQQNFGNGCIANLAKLEVFLYWKYTEPVYKTDAGDGKPGYVDVQKTDSTCVFASLPEVLSSNIIDYKVSDYIHGLVADGKSVITTPGGYRVDIDFPAQDIINRYHENPTRLSEISALTMRIPAEEIENDFGIGTAPYLLMVKTVDLPDYFVENRLPDGKESFYAAYDSDSKSYSFNAMRQYILDLINSGKELTKEDTQFSLVPVLVSTEDVQNYNSTVTYVTRCTNYIGRPTMTLLDTDNVMISFTFSTQLIE